MAAVALAAAVVGVVPASAGDKFGTWTFHGQMRMWHGTLVPPENLTGVVFGTKAGKDPVVHFTIGGQTGTIYSSQNSAGVLGHAFKKGVTYKYSIEFKDSLPSPKPLDPCIQVKNFTYYCRYS